MPRINSSFTAKVRNPGKDTLLQYLVRRFTYHSETEWLDLLALDRLELEGKFARGMESLREGQTLKFAVVDYDEPEVPVDFRIVKRTPDFCLVHKPSGMPVHRTGKIFFQTLANLVKEHLQDSAWAPLNRLDRETSGLVAFARGAESLRNLSPANPTITWIKFYAAITHGKLPSESGSISFPLGESGTGPIRSQVEVLKDGKTALSLYRVLAEKEGKSLLVLAPITGRKHQLRVHLAELLCPIVGDKIYSQNGFAYLKQLNQNLEDSDYQSLGAKYHLLHAFYLHLEKPENSEMRGWDWDWNPEFNRYFPLHLLQEWAQGPGFLELEREAKAAKTTF